MKHTLNINGKPIAASANETLVDAALSSGILIPHDCATGQCETCRVRVAWGAVDDAGTSYGDTVLACQARVISDATLTYEETHPVSKTTGFVESIAALSESVVEITIRTKSPLAYYPGQYAKLALTGYPAREYSFSAPMKGANEPDQLVFQIKRLRQGKVSSAIGKAIGVGHKASVSGPYGNAFLRRQETGPLVLASSGTGFAPIWSLARAVTLANDNRKIYVVAGVTTPKDAYMIDAMDWLSDHHQNDAKLVCRDEFLPNMLCGTPDTNLPELDADTSVHVAGNPALVERVKHKALLASSRCYSDPFTASTNKLGLLDNAKRFLMPSRLRGNRAVA